MNIDVAVLLRVLRNPLQGGKEQVQGGQEGPLPSPQVPSSSHLIMSGY